MVCPNSYLMLGEISMKKFVAALAMLGALSGAASAADLAARPYVKAPAPPPPVYNWTGFYIFGGAGGGLWAADQRIQTTGAGIPLTIDQRQGGSGWFGTVGLGYDWRSEERRVGKECRSARSAYD